MTAWGCGPTVQCGWLAQRTVCGPVGVDWEYNQRACFKWNRPYSNKAMMVTD